MPSYAIVYATVSGQIRRVIADDDGLVELDTHNGKPVIACKRKDGKQSNHDVMDGESVIIALSESVAADLHEWTRIVRDKIGKEPAQITCALINNRNVVEGIICADPAVDLSPSKQHDMIECYSSQIIVGCTYDKKTGLFTTMEGLIPVGAPGNDTQQPIVVPPTVIPK